MQIGKVDVHWEINYDNLLPKDVWRQRTKSHNLFSPIYADHFN